MARKPYEPRFDGVTKAFAKRKRIEDVSASKHWLHWRRNKNFVAQTRLCRLCKASISVADSKAYYGRCAECYMARVKEIDASRNEANAAMAAVNARRGAVNAEARKQTAAARLKGVKTPIKKPRP